MANFTLLTDGDFLEKKYWNLFIENEFSNYEKFWEKFIVSLTNRPSDIHFKTDDELKKTGKTEKEIHREICIAQLHYSVLRHLARVYELRERLNNNDTESSLFAMTPPASGTSTTSSDSSACSTVRISTTGDKSNFKQSLLDILTEGMVRICGAQDVAFELLARMKNKSMYDPWIARDSEKARREWQESNKDKHNKGPLQGLRDYRNHLVHGRQSPSIDIYFPKIGKEKDYLDWRKVTQAVPNSKDFSEAKDILKQAWDETLIYLNREWEKTLKTP